MRIDPSQYREIPANPHQIGAGAVLLPTKTPIIAGGATSLDFVLEQGGDDDTFIFMLGVRRYLLGGGQAVDILEGIFLSESGAGFKATWDFHQLMREVDHGGWTVVPKEEVLEAWVERVEERMNR